MISENFGPIPVKEGKEYEVVIENIGNKGDGIAKVDGFVIVVPGAKEGERLRVRITAVRGKVSFAEIIEILSKQKKVVKKVSEEVKKKFKKKETE